SRDFWRDDEIVVDRDGIPHYTGAAPQLMREYRRRVLFAYSNLEGSGDDEEKERKSLAKKKKKKFGRKLLDALHGEAFRACQDLMLETEKLQAFDQYFDKCFRKTGQSIDSYLRQRKQDWSDLQDVAQGVTMSEELQTYFLLKNIGLSREDKRQILLANESSYTMEGVEKALRASFFDVHERARREWQGSSKQPKGSTKGCGRRNYAHLADAEPEHEDLFEEPDASGYDEGGPEDYANAVVDEGAEAEGEISDARACGDEEVFEAYASYKESRQKLKDLQRSRGFLRPRDGGSNMSEDKKQAIAPEKARTRCSVCGRLGHWAADSACQKGGGSKKGAKKGRGFDHGAGGPGKTKGPGKAYAVCQEPRSKDDPEQQEMEQEVCPPPTVPKDKIEIKVQTAGTKAEVLERLSRLYRGDKFAEETGAEGRGHGSDKAIQLIRWIWREQERAGRYYLIEGPVGAEAWFSNAEILLNRLAKRSWARRFAKDYTMRLDYAVAMSYQEGAFWMDAACPVDMEVEEDEGDEDFEEPWEDECMIRVHRAQRRKLFVPDSSTAPPCRFAVARGDLRLYPASRRAQRAGTKSIPMLEGANAEVILILGSRCFTWWGRGFDDRLEEWYTMSPLAQIRPITAKDRKLYVAVFGKEVGEVEGEIELTGCSRRSWPETGSGKPYLENCVSAFSVAQIARIITDRGKYFLSTVAEDLAGHGCHVEPPARAQLRRPKNARPRGFGEHSANYVAAYHAIGVSKGDLLFGFKRNCFTKTKEMFTAKGGSDEKDWRSKLDLIIPTRWVRTNKNDGIYGAPFLAKSRLVVQGFKDKALGLYRRDAPTASATAESICLAICAHKRFLLFAKDIKNAYFSGKNVRREIYLEQPRGGLPGLQPRQLLRAKRAIYGFAEAARLFWLALRDHLLSDGWEESKLEPALFYLRRQGALLMGILVTHVDDIEGGVHPKMLEAAFEKPSRALGFATNHVKDFIFRGREVKQTSEGHIDVSMCNYALSMKCLQVASARRKQLEDELEPEELEKLQSAAGELGWLTRQLRCDLAYENGVIQKCKTDAVVADLVRLQKYMGQARRGADFRQRYWKWTRQRRTRPQRSSSLQLRERTFILVANAEISDGKEARANIIGYHSSQTKRVCRSTLAAEASHLAEAVEAGDWAIVLLEEALTGQLDLKNWDKLIEKRSRAYVTNAKSVFDYLAKDSTSTSSDKRMAIEGALLRETVRKDNAHVKWIDGQQNIANVLTKKANAEKDTLKEFLRTGLMSLVQTEANQWLKERKREERQRRKA
ncbi:RE1, partial [Symbiodinium necroappetens]